MVRVLFLVSLLSTTGQSCQMVCSGKVDDEEGRLANCGKTFQASVRRAVITSLDGETGQRRSQDGARVVDVVIQSPAVEKLPDEVKHSGDKLELSFPYKECGAKTRAEREAKFKK